MNMNLKVDGVQQALAVFDPKKVERAARATLNRVAKAGKTAASDLIRNELKINISKADLDRKIDVRPARGSSLKAVIEVKGEPIVLSYFGAQQGSTFIAKNKGGAAAFGIAQRLKGKQKTGPVKVTIIKGKTTELNKNTFIARGKGGVAMVFFRLPTGKLLARKVYRESSMFGKDIVISKEKERIIEQWNKEWANQINQLKSGQGWMEKE